MNDHFRPNRSAVLLVAGLSLACGAGGGAPVQSPVPSPASSGLSAPSASHPASEVPLSASSSPRAHYEAWLASRGVAADTVQQATLQNSGEWSFFYVSGSPGAKAHPAAATTDRLVARSESHDWKGFLLSAAAVTTQERVAWLHGDWGALVPGTPVAESVFKRYPDAIPFVKAPELREAGRTVTFEAWYFAPPARSPFRFTIEATDTAATFRNDPLHKIKGP